MITPGTFMTLRPPPGDGFDEADETRAQTPLRVYVERWASPRQTRAVVRIQAEDGSLGHEIVVRAYRLEPVGMMGDLLAQEM